MVIKYLWRLLRHKWFVFLECWRLGIPWLGIIHDMSKFLPSEFLPYARHFYGNYPEWAKMTAGEKQFYIGRTKESVKQEFDVAWLHHQKRNRHHWQYWILTEDSPHKRWVVAPDSPMILAYDGLPFLTVEAESDDAIRSLAYRYLTEIVAMLNGIRCLPMPDKYRKEMLADWYGAGRAYGNPHTRQWYEKHQHTILLDWGTWLWVRNQLQVSNHIERIDGKRESA